VNWIRLAVSTSFRRSATISAYRFALTLPTLSALLICSGMAFTTRCGQEHGQRPRRDPSRVPTESRTGNTTITTDDGN
jgi:hypothetical protein